MLVVSIVQENDGGKDYPEPMCHEQATFVSQPQPRSLVQATRSQRT